MQYDWRLQQKLNETLKLPEITGKDRWWEASLRKFEPTLPRELKKDLDYIFAMSKQNNEEEDIDAFKKGIIEDVLKEEGDHINN